MERAKLGGGHGQAGIWLQARAARRRRALGWHGGHDAAQATSLWALFETWRLFGCYAQGDLLSLRPALHLRRLSLAVISYAPAVTAGQTLTALALTWANPPGQRMLWLGFSSQHYVALLIGLVLLAVSTVLLEAARVADENAEFV